MNYFTDKEKETMLDEYWEFDKKLIHEKYKDVIDKMEKKSFGDLPPCQSSVTAEHDRLADKDEPCNDGVN
jgi:hypothetical protein